MKLLKNRRLLITIFVFILIALIGLLLLTSPKTPPPPPPTPTPTPEIAPTLALTPTPQKLTLNWNNLTLQIPPALPAYTITNPLIDDQVVPSIAAALGFRESDRKTTLKPTSKLYTQNSRSLFASTTQNQITFNATGSLPTHRGLNSAALEQKAAAYLNQFFPNQTFTKLATEYFYANSSAETYPEPVEPARANLIRFSYQQALGGYPLLTTAAKNAVINFSFDSAQTLRSLDISGGFQKTQTGGAFPLLDLTDLQIQSPRRAILLTLETTVDNRSLIDNQLSVVLDLSAVKLVYFVKSDNQQIVPGFLLTGSLKGNFPNTPATYLVPAFR